jgi:hypothetical protein
MFKEIKLTEINSFEITNLSYLLSYLCSFYWGPKFEDLREMTEEENK